MKSSDPSSPHKLLYPEHLRHLPSATEVLGMVTEEGLIRWYKETHPSIISNTSAKTSYIGTIFNEIADALESGKDVSFENIKHEHEVKNAIDSYLLWRKDKLSGMKVMHSQLVVHNKIDDYIGTIDRIYVLENGFIKVIDWKTKSTIKDEPMKKKEGLQLVAYAKALAFDDSCNTRQIGGLSIVRLGRKEVAYKELEFDMSKFDEYYTMFLKIKDIFHWW